MADLDVKLCGWHPRRQAGRAQRSCHQKRSSARSGRSLDPFICSNVNHTTYQQYITRGIESAQYSTVPYISVVFLNPINSIARIWNGVVL